MPQVTEFVPAGADARATLVALGKVAREIPAGGEPFRELRSRLRAAKQWDRERPAAVLRVLGVGGATIAPSPFVTKLRSVASDDDTVDAFLERYFELNPLLFKTVYELLGQRAHGKDELSKYLGSFAYRGKLPSRPDLEHYFAALVAGGVARVLGIALLNERIEAMLNSLGRTWLRNALRQLVSIARQISQSNLQRMRTPICWKRKLLETRTRKLKRHF